MILIDKLRVSHDNKGLEIVTATEISNSYVSLKIKTSTASDFEDWIHNDDYVDLSYYLQSGYNSQVIYIPFGNSLSANSIYVVNIGVKDTLSSRLESLTIATAPLTQFYYCLNKKILKLKDKCDTCLYDVEIIYFLLHGLESAIKLQQYEQSVEFWEELTTLCMYECETCCDIDVSTQTGIGVWVINDNFVVQ